MILNCEEIYFASNEKSALTGQDGFSVRTYTAGMDTATVGAAASACIRGYEVSPDRQLNLEDLERNPRVVYDFPPSYSFSRYADASGRVYWVMGRTVYIATDYGFFLDTDGASRVGSNYFAHLILTEQIPPAKAFVAMCDGNLFRPFDYTVARDNYELRSLLTGEAALLDRRQIEIADMPLSVDTRFLPVVKAVLTARVNRSKGMEESMGKVIVKASAADTASVLRALALLPDSLVSEMTFLTNYMQGYGVPQGYDIAVVNEFNTRPMYEENYVVADITAGTTVNIPSNPIFDAMDSAVADGRLMEFDRLVELFLKTDHSEATDYGFILTVFRAMMTDRGLTVSEITPEFVCALESSRLDDADKQTVRRRMIEAIDSTLLKADRREAVSEAISAAAAVRKYLPGVMKLSPLTSRRVTKMMLGVNAYVDQFVTDGNVETVIALMNRADAGTADELYDAIRKSKSPAVRVELIRWYYEGNLDDIDIILTHVISDSSDPCAEISRLYPLPAGASRLYGFLLRHPLLAADVRPLLNEMAAISSEEFFSGIIANSGDAPVVVDALNQAVGTYFHRKMAGDPNAAMKELIIFIDKVKPIVYRAFSVSSSLVDSYLDHVEAHPGVQEKVVLEAFYPVRDVLNQQVMKRYEALADLYAGRIPESVTLATISTASAMNVDSQLMARLILKWLSGSVSPSDLIAFAKKQRCLAPDVMATMVTAVWQKFHSDPKLRGEAVLALVDNMEWGKEQRQNFISTCSDRDLASFLGESDKVFSKLFRKIKNMF